MTDTEILNMVVKNTAEVLRIAPEKITPQSRFKDDLGADSLDLISLLMTLEQELDRSLPSEREASLVTVSDVVTFVKEQVGATP